MCLIILLAMRLNADGSLTTFFFIILEGGVFSSWCFDVGQVGAILVKVRWLQPIGVTKEEKHILSPEWCAFNLSRPKNSKG